MLHLADLRKTTRRAKTGDLRIVYPTLLRDRSLAPRIGMALRYLDSMLGKPRRELDSEVIVQLFGDHKIARCIVTCLATTYRHRPRTFAEILPAATVAAVAEHGIVTPSDLRLYLFRRANGALRGFVGGIERAPFLRAAGADLGLAPEQIETLIALDVPANAVLTRNGPTPTPDDVIARFNYDVIAALLANASIVRVTLARAATDAETIRALCAQASVRAELAGRELVLHGRQDALNGWARHGARLVHLLSALLSCGLPARGGEAIVASPTGEWLFRLDADALANLGARPTAATAGDPAALLDLWQRADTLAADFAILRRAGDAEGWYLRRAADPVVLHGAVFPALFTCSRTNAVSGRNGNANDGSLSLSGKAGSPTGGLSGVRSDPGRNGKIGSASASVPPLRQGEGLGVRSPATRIPLVPAPSTPEAAAHLAAIAARVPLVALSTAESDAALPDSAPTLGYTTRDDIARLPSLLSRAIGEADARGELTRIESLCDEARVNGVLTEPTLAERLGCDEEAVATRLAMPAARAARQARGIQYIEGFGLCTADTLAKAQAATEEVTALRADQPVGSAWLLRQLGRRLRAVTGASEGIECLIAYLGAA